MKLVTKALGVGVIALALLGCEMKGSDLPLGVELDLNEDGVVELITGREEKDWTRNYSCFSARFSNPDGTYQEQRELIKVEGYISSFRFVDDDGDGDVDLVFAQCSSSKGDYNVYHTYVAKNDGGGNFGQPELKYTTYHRTSSSGRL